MSRLKKLFEVQQHRVLNVYCTAGYPQLNSTLLVMKSLQENGANIIEIGMPYSDPLADGEVIQVSSHIALENGMTIEVLFDQLSKMRETIHIPVVLMGYMNPILQYEFEHLYGKAIKENELDFIFLVTPETPTERLQKLDSLSSGFLYAVSSSATTGTDKDFSKVATYLQKLQSAGLKNPFLVGFGIKDKASFDAVSAYSNGAIIGSAYINALSKGDNVETITKQFLNSVLN